MIHVVEKGDTLRRIAAHYGSTVAAIVAANPDLADPDRIKPGQELTVPSDGRPASAARDAVSTPVPGAERPGPGTTPKPTGRSRPASKPSTTTYTIAAGDTLGKVAKAFGVTLPDLLAANPQITNPDVVKKGQVVAIPAGAAAAKHAVASKSEPVPPSKPRPDRAEQTYTVATGDSMKTIAAGFGVTLTQLIAANPQIPDPNAIKRGQVLTIPSGAATSTPTPSTQPQPTPPRPDTSRKRRNWARVPTEQRMLYVMEQLVEAGYPVNGAAGILGNLYVESGVIPNRLERSSARAPMRAPDFSGAPADFTSEDVMDRDEQAHRGPRYAGVGLAQWTYGPRRAGLFAHEYHGEVIGPDILFDMDAQVDYLVTELRRSGSIQRVIADASVTVDDAADEILYEFERPGSIIADGKRLPRSHAAVQKVFAERRAPAHRALRVWLEAHPR